jgi:hypothetical protein
VTSVGISSSPNAQDGSHLTGSERSSDRRYMHKRSQAGQGPLDKSFYPLGHLPPNAVQTVLAVRRVIAGQPVLFGRAVFLVFKARLHCGTTPQAWVSTNTFVFLVFKASSIAASPATASALTALSSSWSSRPGSIAALPTPAPPAPLWVVFLVFKARLHCGDEYVERKVAVTFVFLVFKARLHCGSLAIVSVFRTTSGLPGLQGQAPLRQRQRVDRCRCEGRVFLVFKARLHCGRSWIIAASLTRPVFLVFKARLHCGDQCYLLQDNIQDCLPGLQGQAPLRPDLPDAQGSGCVVFLVFKARLHCGTFSVGSKTGRP